MKSFVPIFAFGLASLAAPAAVEAATVSTSFVVNVQLVSGGGSLPDARPPKSDTGAPFIPSSLNRVFAPLSSTSQLAAALLGTFAGSGTVTGWRVVTYEGREYVEVTLGW
jgi:hypothetical protein